MIFSENPVDGERNRTLKKRGEIRRKEKGNESLDSEDERRVACLNDLRQLFILLSAAAVQQEGQRRKI